MYQSRQFENSALQNNVRYSESRIQTSLQHAVSVLRTGSASSAADRDIGCGNGGNQQITANHLIVRASDSFLVISLPYIENIYDFQKMASVERTVDF